MSSDSFQVVVDLQVQEFSGARYPVVMVTLPANTMAVLEILTYHPQHMCVHPDEATGNLALNVDGVFIAQLDDRNGNFEEFKKLLDKERMFAVTLTACGEGRGGKLYVLARTVMAENLTGRVVSNTGPQKMSYEEASRGDEAAPESHCTGRSFKNAVEIAIAMHSDDTDAEDSEPRLAN